MPKKQKINERNKVQNTWQRMYGFMYRSNMRLLAFIGVAILLLVVVAQCLYPEGTALPRAAVAGLSVGGKTFEEVVSSIKDRYGDAKIYVRVDNKLIAESSAAKVGIVPDYRQAAQAVTQYSLSARLVPFSSVYKMFLQPSLGYTIEKERSGEFADKVNELCKITPQDARYEVASDGVFVHADKPGRECLEDAVLRSLQEIKLADEAIILEPATKTIPAQQRAEDLKNNLSGAQRIVSRGLTIKAPAESWPISSSDIAHWLKVEEGRLSVDSEKIKQYLAEKRGVFYIEPGVTKVVIRDNMEIARVEGAKGQGIDIDITTQRIKEILLAHEGVPPEAWVHLVITEPRIETEQLYSSTNAGLQALVEQWDRENNGRYGVVIRDLGGKGMNAMLYPDRDFVTASTFKMFLAYAVLNKVQTREIHMDTTTNLGLNVRDCIEEMIVNSTNACATSLFELAGWSYVHHFVREKFPHTSMDNGASLDGEKHTTANDEATFLEKLNAGALLDNEHSNFLLDLMKRQKFRGGIPKGVPGVTVANKVGFYNGYKHDVAIVYAPRGTYILAIMSKGGADWQFADLSRRVYQVMQ